MLINRSNDISRLFGDLRYIVIDEVHTLTGSDRGNQIICQLSRISRAIGRSPRRIGLSATLGDPKLAAAWLSAGSGRHTDIPIFEAEQIRWRLGMEHFFIHNKNPEQSQAQSSAESIPQLDAGYEYMYDCVRDKKSLVFSNSREETEYLTATFRQIANERRDKDIFLIHHGNLSASLREEAEVKMKDDVPAVACATVTMELGIDIGKLERILQYNSPHSVSSFLQRLGRSGRRGNPPEMMMVFREDEPLPNAPLPQLIPWELIRAIAVIQLYIEERFIEPPYVKKMPMSLLFHQTLSILASGGDRTPKELAEIILTLPPFVNVAKEDYKALLVSMINNQLIEFTDEGGLIIGTEGERIINSFKFYAVFKDSEDFTVRCESDEIGTITTPPPPGDRFALAGRVWEVEELDTARRLVYVHKVEGKMEVSWPGEYGEIHTKILERMKRVLVEDTMYPYLKPNSQKRLDIARTLIKNTHVSDKDFVSLGGFTKCMFPWLGTKSFRTLVRYLKKNADKFGISNIEYDGCNYITFRLSKYTDSEFIELLKSDIDKNGIDCYDLVSPSESPITDKFDVYIPSELLRKSYAVDKLDAKEVRERINTLFDQFNNL
jgi:ATP-dependent Lhr-like helicase